MNNYSLRSQFYKYEFNTTEDFPLLRFLLSKNDGAIAEIPCGSGRLINLHAAHSRRVYMVDSEKEMVSLCLKEITLKELSNRIYPIIGDLRSWGLDKMLGAILIPRGGIQLLQDLADIEISLRNLSLSISESGLLYIDIATPGNCDEKALELLPDFMRFKDTAKIYGESIFDLDNGGKLSRKYDSSLEEKVIKVDLTFNALFPDAKEPVTYSSNYQWCRISLKEITEIFFNTGFNIIEIYGDYDFGAYSERSARLICIAQKIN